MDHILAIPFFFLNCHFDTAKNLCRTVRSIKFSCLFACFRSKLSYKVFVCVSKHISFCMDQIRTIQHLYDFGNGCTLFLITGSKPIRIQINIRKQSIEQFIGFFNTVKCRLQFFPVKRIVLRIILIY